MCYSCAGVDARASWVDYLLWGNFKAGLERWVVWRPIHAVQKLERKGMVLHALCKRARIIIQRRGSKREREKFGERLLRGCGDRMS